MSALDKEVSSVVGSGCGGDDGDEDDDDEGGGGGGVHGGRCRCRDEQRTKKQRGKSGFGFSKNLRKAKQVVLHPFTRTKKQLPRRNNTKGSSSTSSSCFVATNVGAFSSGKRFRGGGVGSGNKGCYFCFTQPPTLDSPVGSQISDPEDPNFTYGMLKTFVEKNDFYSKECNPHLDNDIS